MHKLILAVAASISLSGAAYSNDDNICEKGLICASEPATIVAAMQEEGYRAKLEKDKRGDPIIRSEVSGYEFEVYFYGCVEGKNCTTIQFYTGFSAEDDNTPAYANKWNTEKRFIKAYTNEEKELLLEYDISTVGGVNKRNFADTLDWWATMLGEFSQFVKAQKPATK